MKFKNEIEQTDAIGKEIVDFINKKQFPMELLPATLCQIYCHVAAEVGIPPDVFIKTTMTIFAEYTGGEMVFISSDDLESEKEREGATLQ